MVFNKKDITISHNKVQVVLGGTYSSGKEEECL